ncbi:MAG: tetratricopeptide repeat protein [Deltaproteobacteria bacterium]|nr:tetratricopeptide repeat protein [Deltaproteobacteria bacterium]
MDETLKHLLALGRSHYQRKEFGRAERYLTQVVERTQSFADVYNMLGVIFHDQGQFAKARRAFEAALRLNPGYTEAALNLAVIYNDMGKYQEAKEVYTSALSKSASAPGEMDPFVKGKISNMYADIGDVFASSGLWQEAIREYRHALDLCPTFVDIRMKLASALRDAGEKEEAVAELQMAVEQKPGYLAGQIALGVALYSAGRVDEAVASWEAVLDANPGNRTAEMYLSLVKSGADADAVVKAGASDEPGSTG